MTANTAIQYVNKPNNVEWGEMEWKAWLHNFWPATCLIRAADLKEQLQFIANAQLNAFFVVFLCLLAK